MTRLSRIFQDSEVIYDLSLNAINAVFLAGKLTSRVPELVTNLAYTSLKFVGMIYLHTQIHAFIKSGYDTFHALRHRCWSRFSYDAAQAFVQGSGVGLTLAGTAAAVCMTLSHAATARLIYTVLRPWGLVALAIQILLEIVCHLTDDALLAHMQASRHWSRVLAFFQVYRSDASRSSASDLAVAVRSRIDPATWKTLQEKAALISQQRSPLHRLLGYWRLKKLFGVAMDNVRTQRATLRADLSLRAVGYVALAITRAHPCSLIEAVVNSSMSAFWLMRVLVAKSQQADQQEAIWRA